MHIMTFGAAVSLIVFSPIDSENRRLEREEIVQYKRITCGMVMLFGLLYVVLYWLRIDRYAVCISIGMILSALTQIPCVISAVVK